MKRNRKNNLFAKLVNAFMTLALTAGMLWGLQAYSTAHNTSTNLKFVQLSDIHYMENGTNTTFKMIGASPQLLDDAINQINEKQDLDFVMITGDLIDKPLEKELKSVMPYLTRLNYPWYFAFGNHDRCVGGYLTTSVYMDILRQNNKNYKFKKSYYSFVPKKGFKVIVLDDIITDEITSNGYIDKEQFEWLKDTLDSSKNDTVLIFMHVPVIEPFSSPNHKLRNATAVMNLLESYENPIGVFQGHYHATKTTQHDNVVYINTPALVSYPNTFRTVSVSNYKDKTVFELEWNETNEKTIQKLARMLVFTDFIYMGEEKDRNGVFEVKK